MSGTIRTDTLRTHPVDSSDREVQAGTLSGKTVVEVNPSTSGCTLKNVGKWLAVALLVTGFAVGAIGALTYFGILQIALTAVGALTQSTAMYGMIAGGGTALVGVAILSALKCLGRENTDVVISRTTTKPTWTTLWGLCGNKNTTTTPLRS